MISLFYLIGNAVKRWKATVSALPSLLSREGPNWAAGGLAEENFHFPLLSTRAFLPSTRQFLDNAEEMNKRVVPKWQLLGLRELPLEPQPPQSAF